MSFASGKVDRWVFIVPVVALVCVMDHQQLIFAALGSIACALVQALTVTNVGGRPSTRRKAPVTVAPVVLVQPPGNRPARQTCTQPVAPVFSTVEWDAQVDELIADMLPTAETNMVVQRLAAFVKQSLSPMIPEVEVIGLASGNFTCGTAFRVAVPEVDIVLRVDPKVLSARLRGGEPACTSHGRAPDLAKLQKSAIRACTDRLVSAQDFKFRRSAFRGWEPKVTLLARAGLGINDEAIPLDLSVNSVSPFRKAALLKACGSVEPRSASLAMLVRRWAKDRGICHAAKGHLSPYAWTVLVMYFMQVGAGEDGPMLPPLEASDLSTGLPKIESKSSVSLGTLFDRFVRFYCDEFDFRNECASLRKCLREPPDVSLPLQIVLHDDGVTTSVAPSIEDPFDRRRNLSMDTSVVGVVRMKFELTRAKQMRENGASLTELLEPWVAVESDPVAGVAGEELVG